MTAKFLNKEEIKLFTEETGIKANNILLLKDGRYYYVIILDNAASIKIPSKLAKKLI